MYSERGTVEAAQTAVEAFAAAADPVVVAAAACQTCCYRLVLVVPAALQLHAPQKLQAAPCFACCLLAQTHAGHAGRAEDPARHAAQLEALGLLSGGRCEVRRRCAG